MTTELRVALGLSAALHAAVLAGWPAAHPPQFDVERAPTSVELYLLKTTTPPAAEPASQEPVIPPQPQAIVTPEVQGAQVEHLPQYLRNAPPVYPRIARERGEEGTVLLEVEVLESGRCGAVNVLRPSGHAALDEAAIRAVRGWAFRPARRWGRPVPFWVEIPITFRLVER